MYGQEAIAVPSQNALTVEARTMQPETTGRRLFLAVT
jgi:hypothetical protein